MQLAYKSRASVSRELKIAVKASATAAAGQGIQLSGNEVTINLKPGATPAVDPAGYYVVGDFKGWNASGAIAMTKDPNNENLYTWSWITPVVHTSSFSPLLLLMGTT